ncbi:MAG TPA: hypothetical protein VF591_09865 [Pyrinomonadaceae bacterium]|jgi:hypothetical protein
MSTSKPYRVKVCLVACVAAAAASLLLPARAAAQAAAPGLNASERALVAGSREAIIKTGLSAAFFDEHFRVARVVDGPGDRRVVWRLSVGGYEANVNDSVGFYTEGARRVDTHSVAATLSATSDIKRTVTRRRAELLMRRCIGRFTNAQVEYRAHGAGGRAALLLTAQALVPRRACPAQQCTVRQTTLETPPAQGSGGAFNSTLSAGSVTLANPVPPGGQINVQFMLGVMQTGTFKFFVNVEVLP